MADALQRAQDLIKQRDESGMQRRTFGDSPKILEEIQAYALVAVAEELRELRTLIADQGSR
jgi:hypothetical protein